MIITKCIFFYLKKIGLKSYYILVPFFSVHTLIGNCIIKLLNKILKINTYAKMAIFGVRQIYVKSNNFKSNDDITLKFWDNIDMYLIIKCAKFCFVIVIPSKVIKERSHCNLRAEKFECKNVVAFILHFWFIFWSFNVMIICKIVWIFIWWPLKICSSFGSKDIKVSRGGSISSPHPVGTMN